TRVSAVRIDKPVRLVDGQEFGIADLCVRFNVVAPASAGAAPTPPEGFAAVGATETDEPPTGLLADDLATLHDFMTRAVEETDESAAVQCALVAARKLTGADLCGYLSLDPDRPLLRVV